MSSLIIKDGWYVPSIDDHCFDAVIREVDDVNRILPILKQRRSVIQAGGNIGIWAKRLSSEFERVYTFEPDPDNFEALVKNTVNILNVKALNAGLGDSLGRGDIYKLDPKNIGAHQVVKGDRFDIITIDSLGLTDVDLIQLDIEGFEHRALLGAVKTIEASSPAICLELKGLSADYTDEQTIRFLATLGYSIRDNFHRDYLFTRV